MNSQQSVSEANRTRARSFPVLNAMTGRLQCRKLGFNRFSTGQCPEPEIWCQLLGPRGIGVVCIEAHFYANLARNQRSTTIERSSRNGSNIQYLNSLMAEREGFEPPIAFRLCLISSQVHSTGLCHLSALFSTTYPAVVNRPEYWCQLWYQFEFQLHSRRRRPSHPPRLG